MIISFDEFSVLRDGKKPNVSGLYLTGNLPFILKAS